MVKEYWLTNSRFKFIAILLFLMWVGFMTFYFLKADEVTKDPCSICSERMGIEVICTLGGIVPQTKVYYPNGSIYQTDNKVKLNQPELNLSKLLINSTDA